MASPNDNLRMPNKKKFGVLNEKLLQQIADQLMDDQWKPLGRNLGLEANHFDQIEHNYHDIREKKVQMLLKWKQLQGNDATIKKLIEGLRKIDRIDIVDELDNEEKAAKLQQDMEKFYQHLNLPRAPCFHYKKMPLKECYIDLELQDMTSNGSKEDIKNIDLQNIFGNAEGERILIEGNPGCGKTTILLKLAFDWANGESYICSKFSLLILIVLRDFEKTLENTIIEQIPNKAWNEEQLKEVIDRFGENMLLLLDGIDKLDEASKTAVIPLLKGEKYSKATIIVTSRKDESKLTSVDKTTKPKKGLMFHGAHDTTSECHWKRTIQIKGFEINKRKDFLKRFFNKDDEKVDNVFLKLEFTESPQYLIIWALTLEKSYENATGIRTKTDLYKMFLNNFITTNLQEQKLIKEEERVELFSDKEVDYISCFLQFCQMAFECLKQGKSSFTKEEIDKKDGIKNLGLIVLDSTMNNSQEVETYNPIHPSILEFAAAYKIAHTCIKAKENLENLISEMVENDLVSNDSLLHHFIIGILDKKAQLYFKALTPYSGFFPITKDFMNNLYSEIEVTENNIQSLLPFVPPVWEIENHTFFSSDLHASLLNVASQENRIHTFVWVLDYSVKMPGSFKCKCIALYIDDPKSLDLFDKNSGIKNLTCDILMCQIDFDYNYWNKMINILKKIEFTKLVLITCNVNFKDVTKMIYKELTNGTWNKDCSFLIELNGKEDLKYLTKLIDENIIKEIEIDLLESTKSSSLFGKTTIQPFISNIVKSKTLESMIIKNEEINQVLYLNAPDLFQKGNNKWKYISIDHSIKWKNHKDIPNESFNVDGLAISRPEIDKYFNVDIEIISIAKSPQAIAISTAHFYKLTENGAENWLACDKIREMSLTFSQSFRPNHLNGLKHMKQLNFLSLDLVSKELTESENEDLSNIIITLKHLEFLDFNVSEANLHIFLKILQKIENSTNFDSDLIQETEVAHGKKETLFENLIFSIDCNENKSAKDEIINILVLAEKLIISKKISSFHYHCKQKIYENILLRKCSKSLKFSMSLLPDDDYILKASLYAKGLYIKANIKN